MSNLTLALEYQEKALKIYRETVGEMNSDTSSAYSKIGTVYQLQ